jgi:sulfur carrier protein
MKLQINGESVEVGDAISVSELLKVQEVKMPDMVSVELNGGIIQRDTFDATVLADGDKIEFMYFMGGGATPMAWQCRMSNVE